MKILHCITNYYPIYGGLERVVHKLSVEQAKRGHSIYILTSQPKFRYKENILRYNNYSIVDAGDANIKVYCIKALKFYSDYLTIPCKIPKKVISSVDVIHIHNHNHFFNIKIGEKARESGKRVIVHFMSVDSFKYYPKFPHKIIGKFYQNHITKKALKISSINLVKSIRDLFLLYREHKANAKYIPDGIDDYYFTTVSNSSIFRDKFNLEDSHIILYIGRLHPIKGPQILLKAIPYLRRRLDDFKVVLIGPGPQIWLRKLARKLNVEKYLKFTGVINEKLKIAAIDSSFCVVIPSLYAFSEAFSLVASEAWARRKPVVASSVGELRYRVKNFKNGILVPPNDPEALAKAIIKTLDIKFNINVRLLTWSQVADKLIRIYTECITSNFSKEVS